MKITLIILAIVFALLGGSELLSLNAATITQLGLPCLMIAAILFAGAAVVDAVDRLRQSQKAP